MPTIASLLEVPPPQTAATAEAAPVAPTESPEAIVDRDLELAADGAWLDQLARDIVEASGSEGRLRFRLNPEHLGTLGVELKQEAQGVSIRLTADSEAARALIADAQPKLLAEARAQGLRIADTQLSLGGGQAGDSRRQDGFTQDELLRTAAASHGNEQPEERAKSSGSDRYA